MQNIINIIQLKQSYSIKISHIFIICVYNSLRLIGLYIYMYTYIYVYIYVCLLCKPIQAVVYELGFKNMYTYIYKTINYFHMYIYIDESTDKKLINAELALLFNEKCKYKYMYKYIHIYIYTRGFVQDLLPVFILRTGKNTTIGRTAARGTCASQHHGGPIQGPLKPFEHHNSMVLWRS